MDWYNIDSGWWQIGFFRDRFETQGGVVCWFGFGFCVVGLVGLGCGLVVIGDCVVCIVGWLFVGVLI